MNQDKICSKCKKSKKYSEFYKDKYSKTGLSSHCIECKKAYRYRTRKKRSKQGKLYYEKNKNTITKRIKKYQIENKDSLLVSSLEYRKNNKFNISKHNKLYMLSNANYSTFCKQLTVEESPRLYEDGVSLEVSCKYCGKYYIPITKDVLRRIQSLNGTMDGTHSMYCSSDCKQACSIFGQKKYPKGFKKATSREVQPELRKLVLERDDWRCQVCGKAIGEAELHCHHILPINESPIESADVSNCVTLCKEHHKEVHKIPGCGFSELKCGNNDI